MTSPADVASFSAQDGNVTVREDFSRIDGVLEFEWEDGRRLTLAKSAEATSAAPHSLYRGHSLAEVLASEHDLLGRELLALPDDPSYDEIAGCIAPISEMITYAFVGQPGTLDKVGFEYGGRGANFDPAVLDGDVADIRTARRVLDGLVGGWLPVLRFVYPRSNDDWTELLVFADPRVDESNDHVQPVWYRVARIRGGELEWVRYVDTFFDPTDVHAPGDAEGFYRALLAARAAAEAEFAGAMVLDLPDQRIVDQARYSLLQARATRVGWFPKYGVMDRLYGGSEHDGFQDTLTSDVTAALGWGMFAVAAGYLDNYLSSFVRDDGSILYRAAETGQFGRMLTVIGQYYRYTRDAELVLRHATRIDAIAQRLLQLRREACQLEPTDAAYGMIRGWCEADSVLETDPERYRLPYLSNSAEAARGFAELGFVWNELGKATGNVELESRSQELRREAAALVVDLHESIGRSLHPHTTPPFLPTIAGALDEFDVAVKRDAHDPQFRAYRANMELLFSGILDADDVSTIVNYREARHDILLGIPAAYGYNSDGSGGYAHGEFAGFLSYGHAYGLLQHDRVREFLLELYSLSAHQYTRGTWTAPETRRIDPTLAAAPYAVPAQLAVPMLLRWLVAFEEPTADVLWLCKAAPRDWLANGQRIAAHEVPTRWGRVGFELVSELQDSVVRASVRLDSGGHETRLRLRVPGSLRITAVSVNGETWIGFEPDTVVLPATMSGSIELVVRFA